MRFVLLPGQRHDITSFDVLMAGIACLALIGDKAFDAGWLRERLTSGGIEAVIPLREGTTGHPAHDAEKYKWRHLVENFFCAIKAFRRIATRYEKTDTCFAAYPEVVLPDFFEAICPGRNGMQVILEGGDSRSNIGLLPRGAAYKEGARFRVDHAVVGSFPNIEGKRLEWRYHGSKLVALIVRMVGGNDDGTEFHGLVVFRVDTAKLDQACVIGKTTSNEEARGIADDLGRPCL